MTILELLLEAQKQLHHENLMEKQIAIYKIDEIVHELVELEKSLNDTVIRSYFITEG